jgi:Epoxide hydrolase N terminus
MAELDGLDIHFLHVRSRHGDALPLIVTHGWPGSIIEQLKLIGPLTDPTAHGASEADAFDLVIPSLPGHGFSAKPTTTGWDPTRIARAWVVLMGRLGYPRFVAQGGDPPPPGLSEEERTAYAQLASFYATYLAYATIMATRPQTLYGLADSPVDLAAFMLDHGDGTGQPGLVKGVLEGPTRATSPATTCSTTSPCTG